MSAAGSEMLPEQVTRAVMAGETPAVTAWAERHQWRVRVDPDSQTLTAVTTHPATNTLVLFHADLTGYPALPPAWTCRDDQGCSPHDAFPLAGTGPVITGSVFHPNPVICAPWNRLAYSEHSGPHADWGGLTEWKTAAPASTRAHTLADMLNTLRLHLAASPGMAS
ncbi:hypothetical protein SAMN02787118_11817 [Streptomyces mirabilis]|uniref:Uncharacterized protein n=2 Tax=Streptomyces mirabilis TaxID=68239 RepID=A0A1I2QH48_9ACTN|nr:hypothetical protein SAMN02787118_11817 [Streptomyces mirabilis]